MCMEPQFRPGGRVREIASELPLRRVPELSVADSPPTWRRRCGTCAELVQQGRVARDFAYFVSRYGEYVLLSHPSADSSFGVGLPFLAIAVAVRRLPRVRRWTEQARSIGRR